jgi:hypothetical protein
MNCKALIPIAAALLLAACSTTSKSGLLEDTTIGEAKNMTMAAQVIDPDPQYEFLDPPTSAEHAAQAVERYRKDAVKKPERVRSTITSN